MHSVEVVKRFWELKRGNDSCNNPCTDQEEFSEYKLLNLTRELAHFFYLAEKFEIVQKLQEGILEMLKGVAKRDNMYRKFYLDINRRLGFTLMGMGRYNDAQKLQEEPIKSKSVCDDDDILLLQSDLVRSLEGQEKYDAALILIQKALENFTPDNKSHIKLVFLDCRSSIFERKKEYLKSLECSEESLKEFRRVYGVDHPDTAYPMLRLASVYETLGKQHSSLEGYKESLKYSKKAISVRLKFFKNNSKYVKHIKDDMIKTIKEIANTAFELSKQRKFDTALAFMLVASQEDDIYWPEVVGLKNKLLNLSAELERKGHHEDADASLCSLVERFQSVLGTDHPETDKVKKEVDQIQNRPENKRH